MVYTIYQVVITKHESYMPKRTLQPNKSKTKRRHGFRKRMSSESGQDVLKRRRVAGRRKLTV
jgi:large subunit ribosomal protein L34